MRVEVTNDTDFTWPKGVSMKAVDVPEGFRITSLKSTKTLAPRERGTFVGRVRAGKIPNGQYALTIEPTFLKNRLNEVTYKNLAFHHPVQISGDRNLLTRSVTTNNTTKRRGFSFRSLQTSLMKNKSFSQKEKLNSEDPLYGPNIKVKLSFFDQSYALV